MDRLRTLVGSIGLDELLNCILVNGNVRGAFLIQPADYNEASSSDPVTAGKVSAIKAEFPELVLSNIMGETLVSKQAYSEADIRSSADMGKIIGYPCAAEYEHVLAVANSETTVGIEISAQLKPGGNTSSVQLLAYVCLDDRHFSGAKAFAKAAERVLKSDPLVGAIIVGVTAKIDMRVPVTVLIQKLVAGGGGLSADEKADIQNNIWNLGFESAAELNPDYSNPVHRGILIALLMLYKNNPVEPFYPLQLREEGYAVNRQTELLEAGLIKAFADTAGGRGGSKRRTRRLRQK